MSLKDEELKRAKDTSLKFESELKEITLKHTSVMQNPCRRRRRRRKSCFLSRFFFFALGCGGEKRTAGTASGRN